MPFKRKYKIKLNENFKNKKGHSWYKYEVANNLINTPNKIEANIFSNMYEAKFVAEYIVKTYNYKVEIVA